MFLVVLPYISECFVEQILVLDLVLHVNHFTQSLLHLTLTGLGILPAGNTNHTHDFIDIAHQSFYDYGSGLPFYFSKELSERSLGFILLIFRINLLLGGYYFLGQRQ